MNGICPDLKQCLINHCNVLHQILQLHQCTLVCYHVNGIDLHLPMVFDIRIDVLMCISHCY